MFFGTNEAGEKILNWLEEREDVAVTSVVEPGDSLEGLEGDLGVCSGFTEKLPIETVEAFDRGVVNVHPSFLPYNRGAHPYIYPIIDDTPAGVSIHFMDEGLDSGPLVARREVEVRPDDTALSLRRRLMDEAFRLFTEEWDAVLEGVSRPLELERGTLHRSGELDSLSWLDLDEEMRLGDALDLLRALTYGEGLAKFSRDGEVYRVGVEVEKIKDSDRD